MKVLVLCLAAIIPSLSFASNYEAIVQCSGYKLELIADSLFKVNGEFVTSQHIKMLGPKETGMKVDMTLMSASDGNNYGFEYVHRPDSETRFLNIQLLQADMDAPPIIGSFPCKKLSG